MFFAVKNKFHFFRSIQFRQGIIFTLSIVLFSVLVYLWIVYSIYQEQVEEELNFLNHKLIGYYAYYQTEETNLFLNHIRRDILNDTRKQFFIRMVNSEGNEIYSYMPYTWRNFERGELLKDGGLRDEKYITLTSPDHDFNLLSTQIIFYDGSYIQGGISLESRQDLFMLYQNSYSRIFPFILIFSFLVGTLTTSHALAPIKVLNRDIEQLTQTADISRRLKASGSGDQLDHLTQRINAFLEKIGQLIEELKGTMDSAAHDLRTPLTRLAGRAEVALRNPETDVEELRDVLTDTIEDSQEILKIFNTLMTISESEKRLEAERESFSLEHEIRDIADLYSLIAEEKNVLIVLDLAPLHRSYRGSPLRIKQAISNLVDNAVKYSIPDSSIIIRMTGGRGGITIEVENQGEYIAEEEQNKIWTRFYRCEKSRTSEGLGLGLSLVRAVIEAHRGSIDVKSEAGGSTVFIVNLPYIEW